MDANDPLNFRRVLGIYPTGVGVATCRDEAGRAIAMTINSFASLSLSPPLILWSIDRNSDHFGSFAQATHYAINVLSAEQKHLSVHFAGRDGSFDGVQHSEGHERLPLLADCCAVLQCQTAARHDAGDHVIIVGKVLAMDRREAQPLVFQGGQYRTLA